MTSWDFAALKKTSFPPLVYSYCPHPLFSSLLYLSSWKFCGSFYKFFVTQLNPTLASPLQENNTPTLTKLSIFFRDFYTRQASELSTHAPLIHLPLAILAYWGSYLSVYGGECVFFKPTPQFKSFGHF